MMSALGLNQHKSCPIHKAGDTLYLVFTEAGSDLVIWNSRHNLHWSNHCSAEFSILVAKMKCVTQLVR